MNPTRASTQPRSLRDDAARADKLRRLFDPEVKALNELVEKWRAQDRTRLIPWFDPDDGGITARVLVLMEAPGPATQRDGGSGFCSEDNNDPTAATFQQLRTHSGLVRRSYLKWNIVPWAIYDDHGHWTAPDDSALRAAEPALTDLLSALPCLELVICMGARATRGFMRHITLSSTSRLPLILSVPHPSQRNTRRRAEALTRVETALRHGARITGRDD